MAEILIRKAALYDVPAIARIERESFVTPWSAEEITRDIVKNDRAYVAVAELDGETAGYADMWIISGEAQLYNIAVDPAFRRHEVGIRLLEHMMEVASETCDIMTLEVRRSNIPALSLYAAKGFRQTGIRKNYYEDNHEDAVLMDRDLTGSSDGLEVDIEII